MSVITYCRQCRVSFGNQAAWRLVLKPVQTPLDSVQTPNHNGQFLHILHWALVGHFELSLCGKDKATRLANGEVCEFPHLRKNA